MAITLIEPNSLNFAGNPIILKATTDKVLAPDESMLRIRCSVTFQAVDRYDMQYSTELSQPVENAGTASFNLSDASQTLIHRIQSEIDMNGQDTSAEEYPFRHVALHGYTTFQEVWVKDGYEVLGESASGGRFSVIPGRFTDFEMLKKSDIDLDSIASPATEASRKPNYESIVYKGETIIVPTIATQTDTATLKLMIGSETVAEDTVVLTAGATNYQCMEATGDADGGFVLNSSITGPVTGYYRANADGVHFLRFINGFGAVENISVRAKDKLTYETEGGETHSLVQQATTRPTDRRYATKSQPVGVYDLSSGYVPKRWAEWYVQELLTTPKAWMLIDGVWVPGLIEADDDCVIYDRSKPEMPHVDFKFRLAVDGVTGCIW